MHHIRAYKSEAIGTSLSWNISRILGSFIGRVKMGTCEDENVQEIYKRKINDKRVKDFSYKNIIPINGL